MIFGALFVVAGVMVIFGAALDNNIGLGSIGLISVAIGGFIGAIRD